jgi:hypothetical protein
MKAAATYESAYCHSEMSDWTNVNGSGNKKVEFDKPNKEYNIL